MANWLEERADREVQFNRDGAELFRSLRSACDGIVATYKARYAPADAELIDCSPSNPNCFRVRTLPRTPPESVVEVNFRPEKKAISIMRTPVTSIPGLSGDVGIGAAANRKGLGFLVPVKPDSATHNWITIEEMSKELLDPLFFPQQPQS